VNDHENPWVKERENPHAGIQNDSQVLPHLLNKSLLAACAGLIASAHHASVKNHWTRTLRRRLIWLGKLTGELRRELGSAKNAE
jgi:hypothetical protein